VNAADRDRIAAALADETKSFRAVGRDLGLSDWLVRKVARELDGDPRPMRQPRTSRSDDPEELSALGCWLTFGGIVAVLALAIWGGGRWNPPS
jgi:hypothetical protein